MPDFAKTSAVAALDHLTNTQVPALVSCVINVERLRRSARRVDGLIIGTGASDFTKGNTIYPLQYKGKTFQLIDVPGIEGDESRFEKLVKEAVSKAHLVFYVNGTNKKPEKKTAERIRTYLRRGSKVYALRNVRGSGDSYDREEDRVSLGGEEVMKQTIDVLEGVLGKNALIGGHQVQGLMGFCAVAHDGKTTSIHPTREHDLVRQQRSYLKWFRSPKSMLEFSQVKEVARVLHGKLDTFKEDIVQSNKDKVIDLLAENIVILNETLAQHEAFIKKLDPEFKKARKSLAGAISSFEQGVSRQQKSPLERILHNAWRQGF